MSNWCKTCGGYVLRSETHSCPPAFRCWLPDTMDECDARTVHAYSADTAAEKFAERYDSDSGDYPIVSGGGEHIVHVVDPSGALSRWEVTGETVPSYSAYRAPEPDNG